PCPAPPGGRRRAGKPSSRGGASPPELPPVAGGKHDSRPARIRDAGCGPGVGAGRAARPVSPSPLVPSFQVAIAATGLALALGLPLAWLLARRPFPGRDLVTVGVLLPMVLPPTVLGYYLLLLVGREGPLGRFAETLGFERIVFTPAAAVIAALVASFPFLVVSARAGIEQVGPSFEEAARTLGRGEWAIALTVTLPLAWRGILAGTALTFARAVGE